MGTGRIFAPSDSHSSLPGYLGSTSFTAVLAEHRNEIPFEPEESLSSCPVLTVEPDRVQSGAEVLLFLFNFKDRQKLLDKFYLRTWNAIIPEILMQATLVSLGRTFDGFDNNNLVSQLQRLATQIFRNTSRPMVTHQSMTIQEYCDSFTGENLRWEPIGNIFSIIGQQLVITPDNDPDFSQESDDPRAKDRLLDQVASASTICLNFCDQASSANEMLAYLQYNDVMLQTQQYGDTSLWLWLYTCVLTLHEMTNNEI